MITNEFNNGNTISCKMIYREHPTYPKKRKNVYCKYSKRHALKNDVFFYILLIFLLKIETARVQSTNKQDENISNSTLYFSFSGNSSYTAQAVPTFEELATETTLFNNTDSNSTNIMNFQSLNASKSVDFFIGSRMKNRKWAPSIDQGFKNEKMLVPRSNIEFRKSVKGEISRNVYGKEPFEIAAVFKTNSSDNFCESNNSPVIFNSSKEAEYGVNEETNSSTLNSTVQENKPLFTIPKTEEYKEATRMTKCIAKDFNKGGIVCVCNKTYCDKLLPIELPRFGKFSWYKSSYDGYRFHKTDGQLFKWFREDYVEDSFFVYTSEKRMHKGKFIGYGGGFSDSASRNIESLSKQTRRHLMRSYYGLFGLEYNIGRVPIGGTDFSPKFYTYMDVQKKFMLSEQDFKYKIPALQEAIEIISGNLKLVGCSWTAPKWMKTNCSYFDGELRPEYYQLYADYHVMFLDHYAKSGIKFWALSAGNKPMTPYEVTEPRLINGMKWSPYKHSKWVNRYLKPTLNASDYKHTKLIIGDENRDLITYYLKWFFEPLKGENYYDKDVFLANDAYNDVSGISLHGYGDLSENEFFLTQLSNLYHRDKFILLGETACYGKPQLGAWDCAERYAKQMMNGLTGFIDRNLALDLEGGPTYLNNFLDAAIIVNTENDEFYKQPMYYIIAHFSKFLIPESTEAVVRPLNYTSTGIAAIAALRPDDTLVIVAYNRSPQIRNTVFVIEEKYQLSLDIPAKSINSVIISFPLGT